jgi:hypothetical protein
VVVLNSRAQPVDGMQLLQAVATDPRLRLRHGYLVLSKESGWLPPSFRLLEEVLHLRHLVPQDDIGALLPAVTQTVASMTHGLPDPGKTLPPRRGGRPSAPR